MKDYPPLLSMENISKTFPGVRALDNVDFVIYPGEIVGLVGENGAGKSTLMKIVSGVYPPDSGGRMTYKGEEATLNSPRQAQDMGISTIYQELNLTLNQTVYQNIFLGRAVHRRGIMGRLGMVEDRLMRQHASELLQRVGARVPVNALVGNLTVAQQQEVEIAKALSTEAELIIMDEPTSALSSDEVEALLKTMDGLRRQGVAIIFISHRLEEVLQIADRIVVLRDGEKIADLTREGTTMDQIIRLMVGRPLTDFFPKEETEIREVALEAKGLSRGDAVRDVSFQVRRGEILGFAGLVGAGRTESARLVFGADHKTSGEILIDGQVVQIRTPLDAVKRGIGFVPEDRKLQGLVLKLAVRENVVLAGLPQYTSWAIVSLAKIRAVVDTLIQQLRIQTPSAAQKVASLSGGNQQKVVLSKWLALNPKILILDEPTRGIDVGAKAEIHAIMSRLASQGVAIIMISSEMPEILGMSDRIVVMAEGRVTAILDRAEATQERIMAYATVGQEGHTA